METAPLPIVGTETYVSFADAHALAGDRLNAREWRAAVEAYEAAAEAAQLDDATDPLPPLTVAIPTICRQALTTATATLDRMPWKACRVPTQALTWAAGSIPAPIATACAELAFYLLTAETSKRSETR